MKSTKVKRVPMSAKVEVKYAEVRPNKLPYRKKYSSVNNRLSNLVESKSPPGKKESDPTQLVHLVE
jgi:hypothetical protein